jgi:hypothetical protein
VDLDSVIDAYWENYRRLKADRRGADELLWACEVVDKLAVGDEPSPLLLDGHDVKAEQFSEQFRGDPVAMLLALAESAPGVPGLAYLGAGPLEDLLVRGDPDIDRIDQAARRHPNFCIALRCAWFDDHIAAGDAARLRRFGPPL